MTRINKFIAANSGISRRKADEMILAGDVFVNAKKVAKPGKIIDSQKDTVKIKGKKIVPKEGNIYIALNKPAGYITTRSDEKKRKTVMDLIPAGKNLKPAGRLDKETEGLLLFSNNGDFINKLTHPRFECEKEYLVILNGILSKKDKEKLERGIELESKKTSPSKIEIIKKTTDKTTLTITIHEGRNRQVRKMFASIRHNVEYLRRIRIGKIKLGTLEKGRYRHLNSHEINVD